MAFAPDIGLVSMTFPRFFGHRFGMCFLQDIIGFGTENGSEMVHLDTILHELFVKASRHSRDLMNISGQLLGMELLGIPYSFMLFDKALWYSIKLFGIP